MLPLPDPGPPVSPELHQPTAPASGFTFPSASQRETFWNSPRSPGVPQDPEGTRPGEVWGFMGCWLFFGLFLLVWGFPPNFIYSIKLHGFHPRVLIVLPPSPAFPLEILGLSTKARASAEQEDEGFTPVLPLAWKETPLGWFRGISAIPRAWTPFGERQRVPGHGFASGMMDEARREWLDLPLEKQSWEIPEFCLWESLWESLSEWVGSGLPQTIP